MAPALDLACKNQYGGCPSLAFFARLGKVEAYGEGF
jgi:hypothetical protein